MTTQAPSPQTTALGGVRFNNDGTYDFIDDDSAPDELLATIKEFARWHALNEMTIAAGNTPSDSEIDFEAIAWNSITRALGAPTNAGPTATTDRGDSELISWLSADKPFVFDPATNSFHAGDDDVVGGVTYEPVSWNYPNGMDGFDMDAARIGRAAFRRLVDLDMASDTSNDADDIINSIALLQGPTDQTDLHQHVAGDDPTSVIAQHRAVMDRIEPLLPDDWTVSDTETAGVILDYLGNGQDASKEPGADRRRDKIAGIIRARIDEATSHAQNSKDSPDTKTSPQAPVPAAPIGYVCEADIRSLADKPEGIDMSIAPRPYPEYGMRFPLYASTPRTEMAEAAVDLAGHLALSLSVFTKHYESWMNDRGENVQSSSFSRHTFGELRQAIALIKKADALIHHQTEDDDPRVMAIVGQLQKSRAEARLLDVTVAKRILSTLAAETEKPE
jgi:hypothetical protein